MILALLHNSLGVRLEKLQLNYPFSGHSEIFPVQRTRPQKIKEEVLVKAVGVPTMPYAIEL